MIAEVSKGAAALREACAAEPAYQTADDLWKGLKRNDLAAQLVLTFAQRLRFNKRTRHSLPAAKRQEDKRWVRILRQEGWNLYLLMRQRAVPNRKKPGNHTIIPQTDSYGKNYCCADACHTQNTAPVSSQGTGCNRNQWS